MIPSSHVPSQTASPISRRDAVKGVTFNIAKATSGLILSPWVASPRALAQSSAAGITGQAAPEPVAEFWIDKNGSPTQFNLAAQRGKWVHLKFWQSWCPGCHAHGFPALQKMTTAFANEPRVVNVALQTVFEGFFSNTASKVRSTQQRYQLPIIFGHDSSNTKDGKGTMARFRSGGTPWHVIVDPRGRVVFNDFQINVDAAISHIRQQLKA
jgi:thiol-disulfide isomerase/thioredoxin